MARHLLAHDGLFVGSSAAVNCVGAVKVARAMAKERGREEEKESRNNNSFLSRFFSSSSSPPPVVVTLLCDGGGRHLSKFHSAEALRAAGVAAAVGAVRARGDVRFVL
jgi:cysteine synthase